MTTLFSISPLIDLVTDRGKLSNKPTTKLTQDLSSTDSQTRCNAARELGNRGRIGILGKHGNAAIRALMNALAHKDLNTAEAADEALVKIGKPAVLFLKKVLSDDNETLCERAVVCLGNMRENAADAFSAIRSIASQDDEKIGIRFAAIWAVGNIVSKLSNYSEINLVVTELETVLEHPNSHMRYCAAEALGKIGKRAKNAIPSLVALLKDENESVRSYAKWALAQIVPDGAKNITKPVQKTYKKFIESIQEAKNE